MPQSKSIRARSNQVHENSVNSNGGKSPKAVIFARAASAEQATDHLAAQLKLCRDYAVAHGIVVVREFTSVGKAKCKQRGAMLRFLKQNADCRVIIAEKIDSLSRNLHDFAAVEDFVEALKAEIHLVRKEQIIRSQAKSHDRLVQEMFALLARNYIQNMQEELLKGQMVKAEKGQYPGRAPYGYMHNRESRTIEVHPKRGPLVAQMFEHCANGISIASLKKVMRDAGADATNESHIRRILGNRFYLGFFSWKGSEYKGTHQPLVDFSTFERVHAVLDKPGGKDA